MNLGIVPLAHGRQSGQTTVDKGDHDAPQPVLTRLLAVLEKLKGNDDPETLQIRSVLAQLAARRLD